MIDTNKDRQERLAKFRKAHDVVKDNPYWMNFDEKFLPELIEDFFNLTGCRWGTADESNPYYVILRCCGHDVCCMLSNMRYKLEGKYGHIEQSFKEHFIIVLQAYLSNAHRLIDGHDFNENIVGYTDTNGLHLKKFTVLKSDDKFNPYYAVRVIQTEDEYKKMKDWLEKWAGRDFECNTKTWAIECLAELNAGNKIIGKNWLIKI